MSIRNIACIHPRRSILDDNSVSDERQQCFLQAYTRYLPFIRAHLQQTTFSFPNIVDVEWRLDFDLKSNLLEQKREPSYLITITTCNATATSARTPSPSLNTAHPTAQTNTDTSTAAVGDSGRASVPVYSVEKVSFVCSVQELQDLVATLKDACNTVKNQF